MIEFDWWNPWAKPHISCGWNYTTQQWKTKWFSLNFRTDFVFKSTWGNISLHSNFCQLWIQNGICSDMLAKELFNHLCHFLNYYYSLWNIELEILSENRCVFFFTCPILFRLSYHTLNHLAISILHSLRLIECNCVINAFAWIRWLEVVLVNHFQPKLQEWHQFQAGRAAGHELVTF